MEVQSYQPSRLLQILITLLATGMTVTWKIVCRQVILSKSSQCNDNCAQETKND